MTNNRTANYLIKTEKEAYRLLHNGQLAEAAKLLETIVSIRPDFEHGSAWYDLACCYEDLGELDRADKCYRGALRCEPENYVYLGGLASFAYLHGDIKEAYELHLKLLHSDFLDGDVKNESVEFLRSLGEKAALKKETVDLDIQNALLRN